MSDQRVGRNDPCPCGSGKKFKKCCLLNRQPETDSSDVFGLPLMARLFAPPPSSAPKPMPPGRVEQGTEQVIRGTSEHPFYVYGKGWTPLSELQPGDWIRTDNGWVEVNGVKNTGKVETVYNVKVADHHTYFVGTPEWGFGVWAHNADCDVVNYLKAVGIRDEATIQRVVAAGDNPSKVMTELLSDPVIRQQAKASPGAAANVRGIRDEVVRQAKLKGPDRAFPNGPDNPSLLTRLQGTNDPNPVAYSLGEDAYYGATQGYPNLAGRPQQARELAHAAKNGIRPLEVPAEANAGVQQAFRTQYAGKQVKWVVTTEGDMYVVPAVAVDGGEVAHTVATRGKDVMAAGTAQVSRQGKVTSWNGQSGHFRPNERFSRETAEAIFREAGLLP